MRDRHRAVSFAEREFALQPGFTVTESEEGLAVTGMCPACNGTTTYPIPWGTPQGSKGVFHRAPRPRHAGGPSTIFCLCGHLHRGRPTDSPDEGCGAYWKVDLA
jgi:hypothetical protein